MRHLSSPFAPLVVAAVALIATLVRWRVQDSNNVYTTLSKRFYVADRDLGWRISTQHPIWLGLDACVVIAIVVIVLAGVGVVIRRRGRRARALRVVSWIAATASAAVPVAAFASGPGPLHARDTLPARAAVLVEDGIDGRLDALPGTYDVVTHAGTAVTATLSAGGEAFDARFGDIAGTWRGNPRDLGAPMHAEIVVAAASVDTGVRERSKHARDGYLHADAFPRIVVTFDRVAAVRANGRDEIAFRAPATVELMGKTHAVQVSGTLTKLDDAARARLGLDGDTDAHGDGDGDGDVLLAQADFRLAIRETALAPKARDFDGDQIPIHVSLVLRRAGDR